MERHHTSRFVFSTLAAAFALSVASVAHAHTATQVFETYEMLTGETPERLKPRLVSETTSPFTTEQQALLTPAVLSAPPQ